MFTIISSDFLVLAAANFGGLGSFFFDENQ
jgi:hypothetical protein